MFLEVLMSTNQSKEVIDILEIVTSQINMMLSSINDFFDL